MREVGIIAAWSVIGLGVGLFLMAMSIRRRRDPWDN